MLKCSVTAILKSIYSILNYYFPFIFIFIFLYKVHLLAMTTPEAAGRRFIVHSATYTMPAYADILKKEFAPFGYKCTSMVAPLPMLWLLSWWDAQVQNIYPAVGKRVYIKPETVKNVLKYDVVADGAIVITDMSHAAIANGFIADKSKGKTLTEKYQRPEIDLSMIPTAAEVAATL